MLNTVIIEDFKNSSGRVQDIILTYQTFGRPLHSAPLVLVNHALTGNSEVSGEKGWWKELIGEGKSIDTTVYSILAINIPGNGFSEKEENLLENHEEFSLRDIARLQARVLESLEIDKLFAIIGGSIGGALAWELAVLQPALAEHIIPIATDYKTTDWVLAHCKVQDQILRNSSTPVADARMHAMTFYRSPQSFTAKFHRSKNERSSEFQVQSWLSHHGRKLEGRFQLAAYKLMNHLLTTIDISQGRGDYVETASKIEGHIHIIPVSTDWFFLAEENWETYVDLSLVKDDVSIHEIKSIHGHDAFLIENRQLARILKPIFNPKIQQHEKNKHRALWSR